MKQSLTGELMRKILRISPGKSGWRDLLSDNFLLTGTIPKKSRDLYVNNNFFKLVKSCRVKEMIAEGDRG